jgi:transposase-like protein
MSKSVLSEKRFHDEQAAYDWVESRLWPQGPTCPHCGGVERISKMQGKSTRLGLYKCYQCRKPFRVTVGTIFEASHIPLHVWLQGMALMSSSKKGISTNQLHRTLGIGLKAAWFMSHRIREAMRSGSLAPMGSGGGIVEADETYLWKSAVDRGPSKKRHGYPYTKRGKGNLRNKRAIVSLVERGGQVRSFHVENTDLPTVSIIVSQNISKEARVHTDESRIYNHVAGMVAEHETVTHSKREYVRYRDGEAIHTNSAEGYFSIFKRGMKGVYQHCSEKHLHRYLAEFDFRYNNRVALGVGDVERTDEAIRGVVGKRLTYRTAHSG